MTKVSTGIHALSTSSMSRDALRTSQAIMTTDTRPKRATASGTIAGKTVTVAGMAKGAGMIHPGMATMLSVITTDAACAPELLQRAVKAVADQSFNRSTRLSHSWLTYVWTLPRKSPVTAKARQS